MAPVKQARESGSLLSIRITAELASALERQRSGTICTWVGLEKIGRSEPVAASKIRRAYV